MIIQISLLGISELIGHLHPLLVHLPIGILLLAGLFQVLSLKPKYSFLQPAIRIALFWGTISAIASSISGYLLSGTGDYDEQLVSAHQWFGFAVAFVSLITYLIYGSQPGPGKWLIVIMALLIIVTGHLGGSLTHGSDYLVKGFIGENSAEKELQPIEDVQEANIYTDVVQRIFDNRCYTCHNKSKKKGGLRLDEPSFILKGGKDGEVIKPRDANESEMIRRLLLPRNDDDHMPPEEKPQPKENEIALIHWWISTGASFDKKIKELDQTDKIKPILLALQKQESKRTLPDVPQETVSMADEKVVQELKDAGAVVIPVSRSSNYLSVNFVTVDTVTDKEIELLTLIKKQLIWLNLSKKKVNDEMMLKIGKLENLTRLQLDSTLVTDIGIASLQSLKELQYLNLFGTRSTARGLLQLTNLPRLQAIYLYKTLISTSDLSLLKSNFPEVTLDTGGYSVPILETDTTIVKRPTKKN